MALILRYSCLNELVTITADECLTIVLGGSGSEAGATLGDLDPEVD